MPAVKKPYRKPHTTMNRKRYGKVKPVKQEKKKNKFERPPTQQLRSIYSRLKRAASWQHPDILAEAVQWYRRMWVWLLNESKYSLLMYASSSIRSSASRREGQLTEAANATRDEAKLVYTSSAIALYEQTMEKLKIKVPLLKANLKKAKVSAKKLNVRISKVEKRFDSLLTMLSAASNLGVEMGAVPQMEYRDSVYGFHYDATLQKMLYSRTALLDMKKRIRQEGILPVFFEQIMYIARCSTLRFVHKKGFEVLTSNDHALWVEEIGKGLQNFCKWLATNPDAPSRLVKRTVPKKKRRITNNPISPEVAPNTERNQK